jgi:hypothetical protein
MCTCLTLCRNYFLYIWFRPMSQTPMPQTYVSDTYSWRPTSQTPMLIDRLISYALYVVPSYVWNYVAFPIQLVWRPMVSDTVYVPIQGLLTRPLLTMRQREHLLEPRPRHLTIVTGARDLVI